ncbi:MAG: hypothetical protein R3B40_02470 [Polyangiales bacterium]|nr:hypothetical protein [Myxococcales bacterium]MCB9657063.1 hypothetical protein [Sandaracinaceae bacterium]
MPVLSRRAMVPLTCALMLRTLLMLLTLLMGCAQDLVPPAAPAGTPCETLDDCAPVDTPTCGSLRACVDGVCEATPSLYRPCPE